MIVCLDSGTRSCVVRAVAHGCRRAVVTGAQGMHPDHGQGQHEDSNQLPPAPGQCH